MGAYVVPHFPPFLPLPHGATVSFWPCSYHLSVATSQLKGVLGSVWYWVEQEGGWYNCDGTVGLVGGRGGGDSMVCWGE